MNQHLGGGFYCAAVSRAAGEPLTGTAPHITTWFLLEYPGRWLPRAVDDNDLPEPVKARLDSYLRYLPRARLLLIRQRPRLAPPGLRLFVALTHADRPALYEFALDDYDALLSLDLGAVAEGDASYEAHRRARPLFTICMHGRRDRCCPTFGLPVHVEMMQHGGPAVWQSTHIGGHRFAPNVICFPQGTVYGRVPPQRARALMNDCRDGLVTVDLLRGRSCYAEPVQAAEIFLRQTTGARNLDAYTLREALPGADGAWAVTFAEADTGALHRLSVVEEPAGFAVYGSCGDDSPKAEMVFRLLAHERG
ncbi:MAG TPA: sucrase ferredoxin [Aggregatilineaceae bacterium]|nr:hypothetical protein [Anaerolineae bacterium]HMM27593.1 sucrase ferredoxin [Aggregatilineaceae bacterium]HMM27640.1 sucrase ferredoxin [Aggregatilineaceae bacterium]